MTLSLLQIRLIREWYRAKREGRRLVILCPQRAGMTTVFERIRQIEALNPHLP